MISLVGFVGVLAGICWVIQFLPVISVPITGALINYNLLFAHYNNVTFGVFGVCNTLHNQCTTPRIGYPDTKAYDITQEPTVVFGDGLSGIELPSDATHSISKLLVFHVLGFIFTSMLCISTIMALWSTRYHKLHPGRLPWWFQRLSKSTKKKGEKSKDLTRLMNVMLLLALLSFFLTLLAFLADILLFIPSLSYLGWIQLIPVSLMAFILSLACLIKRSLSSRRHLEDFVPAAKSKDVNGDDESDDGFLIFTDGFTRTKGGRDSVDRNSVDISEAYGENIELHSIRN